MSVETLDNVECVHFESNGVLSDHTGVLSHFPTVTILLVLGSLPIHKQKGPIRGPEIPNFKYSRR